MSLRLRRSVGSLSLSFIVLWSGCTAGDIGSSDAARPRDSGGDAQSPSAADAETDGALQLDAAEPQPMDSGSEHVQPDAAVEPPGPVVPIDAGPPPAPKPPVAFVPSGRGFKGTLMLALNAGEEGAEVHYTLDGSLPSVTSERATGPIAIDQTRLVRALAIKGGVSSPVFNQSYFRLDASVDAFSSNLPVVVAHLVGGAAPQVASREYVPGLFGVFTPANGRTTLDATADHTSRFGIKRRGRSTRDQAKPSYTFELWGRDREDAPAQLLGMPSDGDWVLYAPYDFDRAYLRNVFAYGLSNQIGRYAPRTRFCELFVVDGNADVTLDDYVGVYVLTERITRSPDRVPVDKLEPGDVTDPVRSGGYIIKIDDPDNDAEKFQTPGGKTFVYVDPDADEIAPEQTEYISSYLGAVERAISATDGRDPQAGPFMGKHYDELIDVGSFIDHHILNMLMKNPDAFTLSSNFYKQRDGKLFAGPLWDFDLGMGGYDKWGERSVNASYWGPNTDSAMFKRSFWGPLFALHPEFTSAYWARWDELLAGPFNADAFDARIESLEAEISEATTRDRARWSSLTTPPARQLGDQTRVLVSFPEEVSYLEAWLEARLNWVSSALRVMP